MHAFHSSGYLQSKWMFDLSHASVIKVQCMSKWCNPLYWKVTNIKNDWTPFLSFVFHNDWLINHCWRLVRSMTPTFVVVIKVQCMSKWCNPLYWKVTNIKNDWTPFLSFVFHNDWLQNHCWRLVRSMTPTFVVVVSVLLPSCYHIGWDMPYLYIFVEEVTLLQINGREH